MLRKVGFYETYNKTGYEMLAGDGMVFTIARISGPLDEGLVRQAMLHLQNRHPLLQAQIEDTDEEDDHFTTNYFESLSHQERIAAIPLKVLEKTSDSHWEEAAVSQCAVMIESESCWLWRLVWVKGIEDHELLLYSRHEITDATSSIYLMKDLIKVAGLIKTNELEELRLVTAPLALKAPVEVLLPKPAETQATKGPDKEVTPLRPWPYEKSVPVEERVPILLFWQLDLDKMKTLNDRAKKEGVTINSALSAAFFLSEFNHFHGDEPDACVMFKTAITLRNRCEPPLGIEHLGTYVMPVVNVHQALCKQDFWQLAREIGQGLKDEIQALETNGFLPSEFRKSEVLRATKAGYAANMADESFGEGPWISNLGRLRFQRNHGPFQLNELYFGTKQVAGDAGAVLSVVTLHGRLLCCITTAEPLMSKKTVRSILDMFETLLMEAIVS